MSLIRLSVPGKSFLAGEYLAIQEGPALVFASRPRFELLARPASESTNDGAGSNQFVGIHADSPAGKLIADNLPFFKQYHLEFVDPHAGRGGWGASTAQFLAVFVMNEWRQSLELETLKSLSISRLLESYWKYAWNGEGARPSGADLVAQYKGSLTHFEKSSGLIAVYKWPFGEIDFALIATGHKLATHEHLRTLGNFDSSALESAVKTLRESLQAGDEAQFVSGIQQAARGLSELGFVAENTARILKHLSLVPGTLAAKGCGALGADVVLAVFRRSQQAELEAAVAQLGLKVTATSRDLSHGLEIEVRKLS